MIPSTISVNQEMRISGTLNKRRRELTVDVAEPAGLALLCVMQTSGPVDRDVTLATVETSGTLHAASCADAAELKQTVKDRTIVSDIVLPLLFRVVVHVVWRDSLEEVDVFVCVELGHFKLVCRLRTL